MANLYKPLRVGNNPTAQTVFGSNVGHNVLPNKEPYSTDGDKLDKQQDQRQYDDAALLEEARKFLDHVETADNENRTRGAEMLRFAYKRGAQWPDKMYRERQNDNRPTLEINQQPTFINQVLNDIRQNRPAIKVRGASDDATEEVAQLKQDLIRHIEYDSGAEAVYDNGVRYAAVANIGYWRVVTEYESEDSFNQKLLLKPIVNPMSVYWDPDCVEPDGSDAEKCLVSEEIGKDEFERRYPDAQPVDWQSTDPILTAWLKPDTIRIADFLHKVRYKETLYLLPNGTTMWQDDFRKMYGHAAKEDIDYIQSREVDRVEVRWEVINGMEILERHEWAGTYLPVIPCFGDVTNIEGETIRQGLIDRAMDGQQMYNFLTTAAAEAASTQSKAPWLIATGSINPNNAHMWASANIKNFPYLPYDATDEQGKPLPPPTRSSPDVNVGGMLEQASKFQADMRLAIGVPDPFTQMQTQDQSGRAILAKERISATGTYHFVDNLSRAIRLTGKVLLDLIPHIYDTQRTLQLLREDGSQYKTTVNQQQPQSAPVLGMNGQVIQPAQDLPCLNDLCTGKYDVIVDVGPSFASKRVEAVNNAMEITQAYPDLWGVAGDLLVDLMDFPNKDDFKDRLQAMLPPPIQQLIAQKSKDPTVVAMGTAMQQLQQQTQQQLQAASQQVQQVGNENQKLTSENLQLKAKFAQFQAEQAGKDQSAQAAVQTQQLKSRDVALQGQIDLRDSQMKEWETRERMSLEREKLNVQLMGELATIVSKLGPVLGGQAAQVAEQQLPGAERAALGQGQ